jgi:hypothetical protein
VVKNIRTEGISIFKYIDEKVFLSEFSITILRKITKFHIYFIFYAYYKQAIAGIGWELCKNLEAMGFADIPDDQKTPGKEIELLVPKRFTGLDGAELSEMMQLSHASTLNNVMKKRKEDKDHAPITIATTPQIRMTRRICGEYTLHDTEMHRFFPDSIGLVPDWRKRGPVYEVPFSSLYSSKVKNLIAAGRCTSVTDSMWDIMRVIPCCAVTGEAAGIAAAMTDDFGRLNVEALQKELSARGVVLHEKDL